MGSNPTCSMLALNVMLCSEKLHLAPSMAEKVRLLVKDWKPELENEILRGEFHLPAACLFPDRKWKMKFSAENFICQLLACFQSLAMSSFLHLIVKVTM